MRPRFVLHCGPNGSGKSTVADRIDRTGIADYINPDTIRLPDGNLGTLLQAGRIVIQRTAEHFEAGCGFILETTLSGNREGRVVAEARRRRYRVEVVFVCLADVRLNIGRVHLRVQQGGHFVPEEDIRRRYERSLENLWEILPMADAAVLFDNSGVRHRKVVEFEDGRLRRRAKEVPGWVERVLESRG